ncbi:MAG: hypothetical protein KGR98_01055 [Verrucomicrobia bacterium]|nr:hypothetical protein [Verrucomicrobiota bacterium]MDE3099784.1 hypothetical protein [Verrucomicrobiota bacterium]
MKTLLIWLPAIGLTALAARRMDAAVLPTDGYVTYNNTYYVQNWTTNVGSGCFTNGNVIETVVQYGDQRCELRWSDWPDQNTYNQFEMDAMFSPETQNTCIHQIKSNTGGEVIYLQVQNPGTLRNDNGSVFLTGMAGTWFHVNSMFNPVNGDGRAYINGSLEVARTYSTTDRFWYFKCGCYNNGLPPGGISTAWFQNFTNWVYFTNAPPTPTGLAARAGGGQVALSWYPSPGCTNYFVKRSTASGGPYSTIAAVPGTTSTNDTDTSVVNGTAYYYVVSAANAFGESADSAQVEATPANQGFQISGSPSSQTINAGEATNFTLTITTNGNFSGSISLEVTGLPIGASGNFSPATLTGAGTSTLAISTSTNTSSGSYPLVITGTGGSLTNSTTVALTVNSPNGLPAGWTDVDIGSVGLAGSASYNSGTFSVAGSGSDIWTTGDQFNYAYRSVGGNMTVIARVASESGTASYAKAGVMIRETTAADSIQASVLLTPTNGLAMEVRPTTGASSINLTGWIRNILPPQWVKLVRWGDTFTGYYSADGSTWTEIASTNLTMATGVTAGLAVSAHDNTSLNTAAFDNVSISLSPVVLNLLVNGTNLVFSGTNGMPGRNFYVLSSTNIGLALTNWTILLTNSFDGSGSFDFTNSQNPGEPHGFYLLQTP